MKRVLALIAFAFLFACHAFAKPVALFYLTDNPDSIRSFLAHSDKIDLLVPAWYQVDEVGLVSGIPDPTVLGVTQKQHLPVMPIIALFDKKKFHELLGNETARQQMIASIIRECKRNGYTGFQFDFEDISWTDRDGLTDLVRETAEALHKENLQLSIATVPNAPGYPGKGGFSKWIYEDWRGGYDLAGLAKYADLICLMTYDQQTRWTMPGPVAGWQWTVENLDYALKVVPKEKLSLGIPLYGYHWFTGAPTKDKATDEYKPNPSADYISTPNALQLAEAYKAKIQWDEDDHAAFFFFYRDQMREWIFYTDLRTFSDRYKLVEDRGLQGFCSWELGSEDKAIWNFLPTRH
jgi:spore germination protein YaaH